MANRLSESAARRGLNLKPRAVCAAMVLLSVVSVPAFAQWYHVEIVAFRYASDLASDDEQWVGQVWEPSADGVVMELIEEVEPLDASADFSDEPELDINIPTAFLSLPEDEFRIRDVSAVLDRKSDYDLLLHRAWRQPSYGSYRARGVRLRNYSIPGEAADEDEVAPESVVDEEALLVIPDNALDGIVRLKVGNQLNVAADFVFRGDDDIPLRLLENRRVRLREIHYFDHPRFGLLVQVTPFVPEPQE